MYIGRSGFGILDMMDLLKDTAQWWGFVRMVMNLQFS
jgi:hypothetical protein